MVLILLAVIGASAAREAGAQPTCAPGVPGYAPPSTCGACQSSWSYGGQTFCDASCANPDGDPAGPWCYTTQTCSGQNWAYCSLSAAGVTCDPGVSGYVPPDGCVCATTWTYAGKTYCDASCGNPDGDPGGPWCFTSEACNGKNWAYCSSTAAIPGEPGGDPFPGWAPAPRCRCKDAWTYAGKKFLGVCGNPDEDPIGPWCFTDALCSGTTFSYCSPPTTSGVCERPHPELVPASGCACKPQWSHQGKTFCGCANPDEDPKGPWCLTTDACNGQGRSYCSESPPACVTGAACDDGNPCTINDSCARGTCIGNGNLSCASGTTFLKVYALADHALYASQGSDGVRVRDFLIQVMNGTGQIFRDSGLNINVVLEHLFIFTHPSSEGSMATLVGETLETYLDRVTRLANDFPAALPQPLPVPTPHAIDPYDVVVLFTADRSGPMIGLAWVDTLCRGKSVAVVEVQRADAIGPTAATTAHELGHILGASHDGSGNTCAETGYLMAANADRSVQATLPPISSCTRSSFLTTLQRISGSSCGNHLSKPPRVGFIGNACGDGILGAGEECDDGNAYPRDGCWLCKTSAVPCDDGNACTQTDYLENGICTGRDPVGCPPLDCFHDAGTCDPESGRCTYPARVFSMSALEHERDQQCASAWSTYTGRWIAGGREGIGGSCDLGCGQLSCTNGDWGNYCFGGNCSCLASPIDAPVGVKQCSPCLDADGNGGFCVDRVCVPAAGGPTATPDGAATPHPTATPTLLPDALAPGDKLTLARSKSGTEKLKFETTDPVIPFPTQGSSADPTIAGASLEVVAGFGGKALFHLPAEGWSANKKGTSYKFTNPKGSTLASTVKAATIKLTRKGTALKVNTRRVGLRLEGAQGAVGVRLTIGSQRICAHFRGEAIKTDEGNKFAAAGATSASDCDVRTLESY